jgi:hypothetical protein
MNSEIELSYTRPIGEHAIHCGHEALNSLKAWEVQFSTPNLNAAGGTLARWHDSLPLFFSSVHQHASISNIFNNMPFVLTNNPVDLDTQSGLESRFGRQRFVAERTSVCDVLCHLQSEADFY